MAVSQIALSFGIRFALIPLLLVTTSRRTKTKAVNTKFITGLLGGAIVIIVLLNLALIRLIVAGG